MESEQIQDNKEPAPRPKRSLAAWVGLGFATFIAIIIIAAFIASFFLDGIIRPRIQAAMNSNLKGYHVTLGHAHLQLIGGQLTLKRLVIVQQLHPTPPLADFPQMRFHIYWRELLTGHVMATVSLWAPKIHINRPQLTVEAHSKTPLRQRGWQDAMQAAYPLDINRFSIYHGDVTYIDSAKAKPIHLENINFVTDNIRNIHEPNNVYPSRFHGNLSVFGKGRLRVKGRANYLMKPFPGIRADYSVTDVPLGAVTPASRHVNMAIKGGILSSEGTVEYSPKVTNVDVSNATIDDVDLTYVHLPQTQGAEKERITNAGKTVEKENNRPTVYIKLQELDLKNSRLAFADKSSNPPYSLFLADSNLKVTNLSNHASQGVSHVELIGKFMGSGATRVYGTFVAGGRGPEFNTNIAILNTDMTALNPLLHSEGRIEVAQGLITVYAQLEVKNSRMNGYVKPLFSNMKVYDYQQEKKQGLLHQAKEMVIGAASHIFKNQSTKKVATEVNLSGNLKKPNLNTWQAFVEVVRNAFIQAILPGFDRQIAAGGTQRANAITPRKGG